MTKGPIPPEAWLMDRTWGRDIVHLANDETDRISVAPQIEWADLDFTPQTVVTMSLISSAKRDGGRTPSVEEKAETYRKNGGDGLVACGLHVYVKQGRRAFSFGEKELDAFLDADAPRVGDLPDVTDMRSFYAILPRPVGRTTEGHELDGFLISHGTRSIPVMHEGDDEYCEECTEDEEVLYVYPMSRTIPGRGEYSLYPVHCIPLVDPEATIEDCLAEWSESYRTWYDLLRDSWNGYMHDPEEEEEGAKRYVDPMEMGEIKATVGEAHSQVLAEESEANMTSHISQWARIIAGVIGTVMDPTAIAIPTYPENAPENLVTKAMSRSAGHRKAEQRLASMGMRPILHYEKDAEGGWPVQATTDEIGDAPQGPPQTSEPAPEPVVQAEASTRRIDPRKQKRKTRTIVTAPSAIEKTAVPSSDEDQVEPGIATAIIADQRSDMVIMGGDEARKDAEELLRRCMRDAPDPGTRNWKNSMSSAYAGIIMRRIRVATMPREMPEATRKRLAAGIAERICALDETLEMIDDHAARNGRDDHVLPAISTLRAVDPDVPAPDGVVHHVVLADCHDIAAHIAFPGVEPGNGHEHASDCRVILRYLRQDDVLHIEGFAHEGCLIGYRHVILDLDDGSVEDQDSQSDADDADDFADKAYAALCDVILGPVEPMDAWQWEIEYERFRNRAAADQEDDGPTDEPVIAPMVIEPTFDIIGPKAKTPVMTTFHSWDNLVQDREGADVDDDDIEILIEGSRDNAVSAHMAHVIRNDSAAPQDVMRAWRRYACSIARSDDPVFTKIESPRIRDNVDLRSLSGTEGVLVLRDTALLDNAHTNLVAGGSPAKARAFCVYYRIHLDGFSALVLQDDGGDRLSFASWTRASLETPEDESEMAWYLRSALHESLRLEAEGEEEEGPAVLPAVERQPARDATGFRQGPRRVIAQMRLRPASMAVALRTVAEWFDEQVGKHGDMLVSDLREQGDWTLEHLSDDNGVRSLWAVSVLTPEADPHCVDIVLQTTLATGVSPRLPAIVRRIAAATPTQGPDGLLRIRPDSVRTKGEVLELIRELQSPERVLPILLMTQDERGEYLKDPSDVARQGMGALTVKTISQGMTYELTDRLGQEYRTFGGAVRLFQPGFDPDNDTASRHPRIMPDMMASRTLAGLISRATAATVTRYDIPDAVRPARPTLPPVAAPVDPVTSPTPTLPASTDEAAGAGEDRPDDRAGRSEPVVEDAAEHEPGHETSTPAETYLEAETAAPEEVQSDETVTEREKDSTPSSEEISSEGPVVEAESAVAVEQETAIGEADAEGQMAEAEKGADRQEAPVVPPVTAIDPEEIEAIVGRVLDKRIASLGLGTLREDIASLFSNFQPQTADDRDAEIARLREELRIERESSVQLLDESDAARQAAVLEVDALRQALNERRRAATATSGQQYPEDLSGLGDWLDRNVLPNVVITSKAWRNMRNVDYRDMERLCETLKLLDGAYIDMRAGEEGAREAWQEGLQKLRLEDKKQTRMGRSAREGDYKFTHEGEPYVVERHLRGNESLHNDHSRLLRIYYTYDTNRARVLIGSMPRHAHTRDS